MTAPSLIHVGLMQAAKRDAGALRFAHELPPSRGGPPPNRARGAAAAALARAAARFDAEAARRAIA
jgi:hypothetical protein